MQFTTYDLNTDDWTTYKTHFTYFNFLGLVYEPRFNLISFSDRASISLSVPLSGKVNVDLDDDNIFVIGGLGGYADFNIGNRATFNNIDANGYALGVGMDIDKYFNGDVDGMVYSPAARLKIMSLINSVYDYYFGMMLKAGIPVVYDDASGGTSVGNKYFGIYISLGF